VFSAWNVSLKLNYVFGYTFIFIVVYTLKLYAFCITHSKMAAQAQKLAVYGNYSNSACKSNKKQLNKFIVVKKNINNYMKLL